MLRIVLLIFLNVFIDNSMAQRVAEELRCEKLEVYDFSYQIASLNTESHCEEKILLFLTGIYSLFVSENAFFRGPLYFTGLEKSERSRFEIIGGTVVFSHTNCYIHKMDGMIT